MRRSADERGATMVELAFVSTILFSILLGMLSFVLVEASDVSGTNAAREGARQGILDFDCADLHTPCANPNPALTAIKNAVTSKLGTFVVGSPTVTATCLDGSATPLVQKPCDAATIVSDVDLLRVSVTWTRLSSTAFGTATTHTDSATMTIQGSGKGSTDVVACIPYAADVSPSTSSIGPGLTEGPLWPSTAQIVITVHTNGLCAGLYVQFATGETPDQAAPTAMTSGTNGVFTYTISASQYNWAAGTYDVIISDGVNAYSSFGTFVPTITIVSAVCSITASSVSPSAALLSGPSPNHLTSSATISITTSAGCVHITTTFTPNSPTSTTTAVMTGSAPNFSLVINPNDYTWTPGAKQFIFTDTDANKVLQSPQTVILQIATACAITVQWSPSAMANNQTSAVAVSATPVQGASCTGLTLTYGYKQNGTASVLMTQQSSGVYTYTIPTSTNWQKGTWTFTFASTNSPAVTTSPSPINETIF